MWAFVQLSEIVHQPFYERQSCWIQLFHNFGDGFHRIVVVPPCLKPWNQRRQMTWPIRFQHLFTSAVIFWCGRIERRAHPRFDMTDQGNTSSDPKGMKSKPCLKSKETPWRYDHWKSKENLTQQRSIMGITVRENEFRRHCPAEQFHVGKVARFRTCDPLSCPTAQKPTSPTFMKAQA